MQAAHHPQSGGTMQPQHHPQGNTMQSHPQGSSMQGHPPSGGNNTNNKGNNGKPPQS
jgi:hypothetical protein